MTDGYDFMGDGNAERIGYFEQGRNIGKTAKRQCADNLPAVQRHSEEQVGPVPVGHVHLGRGCMALLALRLRGGRIL